MRSLFYIPSSSSASSFASNEASSSGSLVGAASAPLPVPRSRALFDAETTARLSVIASSRRSLCIDTAPVARALSLASIWHGKFIVAVDAISPAKPTQAPRPVCPLIFASLLVTPPSPLANTCIHSLAEHNPAPFLLGAAEYRRMTDPTLPISQLTTDFVDSLALPSGGRNNSGLRWRGSVTASANSNPIPQSEFATSIGNYLSNSLRVNTNRALAAVRIVASSSSSTRTTTLQADVEMISIGAGAGAGAAGAGSSATSTITAIDESFDGDATTRPSTLGLLIGALTSTTTPSLSPSQPLLYTVLPTVLGLFALLHGEIPISNEELFKLPSRAVTQSTCITSTPILEETTSTQVAPTEVPMASAAAVVTVDDDIDKLSAQGDNFSWLPHALLESTTSTTSLSSSSSTSFDGLVSAASVICALGLHSRAFLAATADDDDGTRTTAAATGEEVEEQALPATSFLTPTPSVGSFTVLCSLFELFDKFLLQNETAPIAASAIGSLAVIVRAHAAAAAAWGINQVGPNGGGTARSSARDPLAMLAEDFFLPIVSTKNGKKIISEPPPRIQSPLASPTLGPTPAPLQTTTTSVDSSALPPPLLTVKRSPAEELFEVILRLSNTVESTGRPALTRALRVAASSLVHLVFSTPWALNDALTRAFSSSNGPGPGPVLDAHTTHNSSSSSSSIRALVLAAGVRTCARATAVALLSAVPIGAGGVTVGDVADDMARRQLLERDANIIRGAAVLDDDGKFLAALSRAAARPWAYPVGGDTAANDAGVGVGSESSPVERRVAHCCAFSHAITHTTPIKLLCSATAVHVTLGHSRAARRAAFAHGTAPLPRGALAVAVDLASQFSESITSTALSRTARVPTGYDPSVTPLTVSPFVTMLDASASGTDWSLTGRCANGRKRTKNGYSTVWAAAPLPTGTGRVSMDVTIRTTHLQETMRFFVGIAPRLEGGHASGPGYVGLTPGTVGWGDSGGFVSGGKAVTFGVQEPASPPPRFLGASTIVRVTFDAETDSLELSWVDKDTPQLGGSGGGGGGGGNGKSCSNSGSGSSSRSCSKSGS